MESQRIAPTQTPLRNASEGLSFALAALPGVILRPASRNENKGHSGLLTYVNVFAYIGNLTKPNKPKYMPGEFFGRHGESAGKNTKKY